ncbi:hypothetical protein BD410DRAFT_191355 [Rickenella mellea]|uniref:Uncharacterized protein n=1 Tax=Rickenella mellea TaxID=50990 RepID=A0A4Y7PGX8_9AGAM|nr:hypothetical protein BD410DRAFT_191355 [Rickenella mellea]
MLSYSAHSYPMRVHYGRRGNYSPNGDPLGLRSFDSGRIQNSISVDPSHRLRHSRTLEYLGSTYSHSSSEEYLVSQLSCMVSDPFHELRDAAVSLRQPSELRGYTIREDEGMGVRDVLCEPSGRMFLPTSYHPHSAISKG